MPRRLPRWLVTAFVVLAALSAGVPLQSATAAETLETDSVLIEVDLQPDGDAVWRVEYRYVLDDRNATRTFEAFRARIGENRSRYTSRFAERMRRSVAAAENSTGRPMSLGDVTVSTGRQAIPQGSDARGMVTYEFTWRNFSVANATHVRAGDAIHGFYVSPKTTLIVTWPDDYEPVAVVPDPDERSTGRVVWEGETAFASDEPSLVVAEATAVDGMAASPTPSQTGDGSAGGLPLSLVLAAAVVVSGAGVGGAVALRRRDDDATASESEAAHEDDQSVPPELMSNEERVRAALEDHGGRMKQQELAEACDWHPSKTSKVVNDLKEDGAIDVFRLGRENIVSLPEEDIYEE